MTTIILVLIGWLICGLFNTWVVLWWANAPFTQKEKKKLILLGPIVTALLAFLAIGMLIEGPTKS